MRFGWVRLIHCPPTESWVRWPARRVWCQVAVSGIPPLLQSAQSQSPWPAPEQVVALGGQLSPGEMDRCPEKGEGLRGAGGEGSDIPTETWECWR